MAGFLYRMVQRGLGRTRTAQPLYTARYARDAAPAALPSVTTHRNAAGIARQAEAKSEDEEPTSGDLARSPADGGAPNDEEEKDNAGEAPLVQSKALHVNRRATGPTTRIHRQADGEEDEAAGAGDGTRVRAGDGTRVRAGTGRGSERGRDGEGANGGPRRAVAVAIVW